MTRVAVLDDWQQVARASADWSGLEKRAEVVFFHAPFRSTDEVVTTLSDFDAILAMRERTPFPPEVITKLPRLRFFNMTGRRARGLDELVRQGVTVSITGGGETGEDTAEHTLALMLSAVRRVPEGDAAVRSGRFQQNLPAGSRLAGKTLGILGYGLIGERVARYGQALGMDVVVWSRSMTSERARAGGVTAVGRDELFDRSDVVSINLVLSPETDRIVGAREIAGLKPGALIVNTSRAGLIDEPALLQALHAGRIQAALDVFDLEPLPAGHPLLDAPNTVLTPHVGYGTLENYRHFFRNSVENVIAFLDGAPIRRYTPELHEV